MIHFHFLILSVTSLTSFQSDNLVDYLNPYFEANESGSSSRMMTNIFLKKVLSLLIFTGLLNASQNFIYYLILVLISTALLVCMENTFWDINRDGNFVELFKKSFTLYVKSGMKEMVKIEINMLRNEQGEFLVTKDFKAIFCKFIVEHYLCKFHCFYLHLTHLITFFT